MRAKSLKSSQILGAHMPYFLRPGHICKQMVWTGCVLHHIALH